MFANQPAKVAAASSKATSARPGPEQLAGYARGCPSRNAADLSKTPIHAAAGSSRAAALAIWSLHPAAQAKLEIGAPNDPLEHEADRIADRVMQMPSPAVSTSAAEQRPPALRRKCTKCEEESKLRRAPVVTPLPRQRLQAPGTVHEIAGRPGRPLDRGARDFFEPRLVRDLGHVRIHTDSWAAESAKSVGAQAYTVGHDIVFAEAKYQPDSHAGRRLLAHELAHTLQQDDAGERRLQRFLSTEPAGGCGLCYGLPKNAGDAAHRLIQMEFEVLYPLGLTELNVTDPSDKRGRLDLAVAVPGGFEIGEIKPANEQGYADGIKQISKYIGLIEAKYPGSTIRPLTKLLPPVIFPTLSTDCPIQALFVNPPVGGVYGYFCEPSFSKLKKRGCKCPVPRKLQEEKDEETETKNEKEKEKEKKKENGKDKQEEGSRQPEAKPQTLPQPIPVAARSAGEAILELVREIVVGGLNVEQAVRKFLTDNPDILRNLELAVAAIVAGAIASDILSGGGAIAKDPAVAAILAAMLRIGGELKAAF